MDVLERMIRDLQNIAAALQDRPELARRIHDIAGCLSGDEVRWISQDRAERMLGVQHPETIATWVRLGLLRGRQQADGTLLVKLDDVLDQQEIIAALDNGDDRELTAEEQEILSRSPRSESPVLPAR